MVYTHKEKGSSRRRQNRQRHKMIERFCSDGMLSLLLILVCLISTAFAERHNLLRTVIVPDSAADFWDQQSELIRSAGLANNPLDEECITNLQAADEDDDGQLNYDEVIIFIQLQSECEEPLSDIPPALKPFFVGFACLCLSEPGALLSCCSKKNSKIPIPSTEEELNVICNLKYLDSSYYCGEMPPSGTSEKTMVPSLFDNLGSDKPSDLASEIPSDGASSSIPSSLESDIPSDGGSTDIPDNLESEIPSDGSSTVIPSSFASNGVRTIIPSNFVSEIPSDGDSSDSPSTMASNVPTIIGSYIPSDSGTPSPTLLDINCTTISDGLTEFELCYTASLQGSSGILAYENGTTTNIAYQSYLYSYIYYNKNDSNTDQGIEVMVSREGEVDDLGSGIDRTECTGVVVDGVKCNSCSYCGDEEFSADCTNIIFGRLVECESSWLFFPLTAEALALNHSSPDGDIETTGPSDLQTANPSDLSSDSPSYLSSEGPSDLSSDGPSDLSSDIPSDLISDTPSDLSTGTPNDSSTDSPSDMNSSTLSQITDCTDISDGFGNFEVCYTASFLGPTDYGIFPNYTFIPADEGYLYDYIVDNIDGIPSINIQIGRSGEIEGDNDLTVCDFVRVNSVLCTSCVYCGSERFSADCSNIPYGRKVACEPSKPLFFPLSGTVLSETSL